MSLITQVHVFVRRQAKEHEEAPGHEILAEEIRPQIANIMGW